MPGYPTFIHAASGFSGVEEFGRWTDGPIASLSFSEPLPARFVLQLDIAGTFGPNVGKHLKVRVGDWEGAVLLAAKPQMAALHVTAFPPADRIEFHIPQPTSPRSSGASSDGRLLGVAFKRISVKAP